jgi:hypothetical protein
MELLLGLGCLAVLFAFVAVVGHGLWLMFAAVGKSVFGPDRPPGPARRYRRTCPGCRAIVAAEDRHCLTCGLGVNSPLAAHLGRIRTAVREVRELAERGELDQAAADQVVERLERHASTLHEAGPHPAARRAETRSSSRLDLPSYPDTVPATSPPPAEPIPVADLAEPSVAPAAPPEPPHHRHGVLAAFMEEKNILWGEVVGGLLIVGCSIALVLTLWKQLEALPYFPFLLDTAVTAALFGAGQYTLHHWKLAATSRGLLVIALLLCPLDLLLLANPGVETAGGWLDVGIKLAAVVVFVGMVRAAGRDLIGTDLLPGPVDRRWLLALAVVGAPASQALPMDWAGDFAAALPTWLPLTCDLVACGAVLGGLTWYRPRDEAVTFSRPRATVLIMFIGISLFALFAAWGLVFTRSPDLAATVLGFAIPLTLAGLPVVEAGLLARRTSAEAGVKTTGTGMALAGSVLFVLGATLAWPDPLRLTLVAAVVGGVFTRVAWRERSPGWHVGSVPALGLAAVLATHGLLGHWPVPDDVTPGVWLKWQLGSSTSGVVLAGYGVLLAGVAEWVVRRGNRPQAIGCALGGLAAGVAGLYLVNIHGMTEPWAAAWVHVAVAVGMLGANVRWRTRAAAQGGAWLLLVATLWFLHAIQPTEPGSWAFVFALEALTLAGLALGLTPRAARPGPTGVVYGQFRVACRDVATAATVVAVLLAAGTGGGPHFRLHTATFLILAPVGLILARVFARPWPTWAGTVAALVGLILLTVFATEVRPVAAALLLALLGHATLALAGALAFRGRRSRARLFGTPLLLSAHGTAVLAALFLLFPSAGFATEWAGFAAWLAAVWFAVAWVWREVGAVYAMHLSLAAAAVLCGLAWVERQGWWADTPLGPGDPRALQAFGIALALLGLAWVAVRRAVAGNDRLRALWLNDPLAADRLVTGAVIVGQLILLAAAVEPAARAELTPLGLSPWPTPPPEMLFAFGPGAWALLGLLAVGLLASLRLGSGDEPAGDAIVTGLALLAVSVPMLVAGSFAPELAAASALRWGLAGVFLVGSAAIWAREPLARLATRAGVRTPVTAVARNGAIIVFTTAAAVAVVITLNVTELGLRRFQPTGPAEGSVFERMGYTASFLVPLGLLIVGLAGSAVRERSAGYAFAAGLVFAGAITSGYTLSVVTSDDLLDAVQRIRIGMLAAGSAAAWALLWLAASRRIPGGPLLGAQATFGLVGVGLLALVPLLRLFSHPSDPLAPAFAEIGRFGWVVLALAGWAGVEVANRAAPKVRPHIIGFAAVVAGVLAACAVQPWDAPGQGVSFHTLTAAWAVAGLGLTATLFAAPAFSRGAWAVGLAGGLAAAALVGPTPEVGRWPVPLALAAYALASVGIGTALGHPQQEAGRWLAVARAAGITAAVAVPYGLVVTVDEDHLVERLAGPLTMVLLAVAAGLFARAAPADLTRPARFAALIAAAVGVALVGWAIPNRDTPALWLQRNGWAFVALVAAAVSRLELLPRVLRSPAWAADSRRVGGGLGLGALAALVFVLLQQVPAFNLVTRRAPLDLPEVLAILTGIGALIAVALRFALSPTADPLGLPDSRRTRYVYLAEVLLVLFFFHVRLNLPELFLPRAVQYWTFLVMLLAFVGIGLAELFERRGVMVLAGPLRRTGVLLPLIPLLAFWTKPPAFLLEWSEGRAPGARPFLGYLEKLPQHFDNYAGLWFLAGLLYGLVALSRRSFGWALLGALATNAGVWALLAYTGVSAAVHPQGWVIPLALIVLVSEHVNRRELRPDAAAGLRYLGIGMLYVSSAADMFIAGIGESLWLPVVLAALCVAGIFAGILLRVRAFLFLGVGFLLLDVFAMIWHAAVDRAQTWVWYASGIVLGTAILALFALFEKRRNDALAVVERVRRWD